VAKATTEPATVAKATTEPATAAKATTEPATVAKATTEPGTVAKATTEPATVAKGTIEPATVAKATTEPATAAKATTEQATAAKVSADQTITAEVSIDQTITAKVSTENSPSGHTVTLEPPPTNTPTPSPVPITVNETTPIPEDITSVELDGSGTIKGETQLILESITVTTDSTILAENLTVSNRLELRGSSILRSAPGHKIEIAHEILDIVVISDTTTLPKLDLGDIGSNYMLLPQSVTIDLSEFNKEEKETFSKEIISGRTLSNCEAWKAKTTLTDTENFFLQCETIPESNLLSGEIIALVVKGKPKAPVVVSHTPQVSADAPNAPPPSSKKLSGGAIAGIVIAVLAVVVVAGVAVYYYVRRQNLKPQASEASSASSSTQEDTERVQPSHTSL
jgi:hypothetical protein